MWQKLFQFGLIGSIAVAAESVSAEKLAFHGTFEIEFATLAFGGGGSATGTGVATVNGSNGFLGHLDTLQLPPGWAQITTAVTGTAASLVLDGIAPGSRHATTSGLAARFGPISGAVANTAMGLDSMSRTMEVLGNIRLCVDLIPPMSPPHCGATGTIFSLTPTPLAASAAIGVGGTSSDTSMGASLRWRNGPWTVKTASATFGTGGTSTTTRQGFVHGPASMTSSTAVTSGALQLVTASQVTASVSLVQRDGLFTTMTIHFVPEPNRVILLASGALCLLLLGRRRLRATPV